MCEVLQRAVGNGRVGGGVGGGGQENSRNVFPFAGIVGKVVESHITCSPDSCSVPAVCSVFPDFVIV